MTSQLGDIPPRKGNQDDPWERIPVPEWLRPHVSEALRAAPNRLHRLLGEQYKGSFHKPEAILSRFSMMTHGHEWLPEFVVSVLQEAVPFRAAVRALEPSTVKSQLPAMARATGPGRIALALWLDVRPEVRDLATAGLATMGADVKGGPCVAWEQFVFETFVATEGVTGAAPPARGADPAPDARATEDLRRRVREAEESLARERKARREEVRAWQAKVEDLGKALEKAAADRAALEAGFDRRLEEALRADRADRMKPWMARAVAVEEMVEAGASETGLAGLLRRAKASLQRHEAIDPHASNMARLRAEVRTLEEQRDEIRLAMESALHRCPDLEEVARQLDGALVDRRRLLGEVPASQPWVHDIAIEVARATGVESLAEVRQRVESMARHGLIGADAVGWLGQRIAERQSALGEPALAATSASRDVRLMDVLQGRAEGRILIDTFNLIGHAGDDLGVSKEPSQFLASIRKLESWMRRLGRVAGMADIRFVADGPREGHRTLGRTVRVEWSGGEGKHRADKVIVGMLKAMSPGIPSWVVTHDHELARACIAAGAKVESPVSFMRRALKAGVVVARDDG